MIYATATQLTEGAILDLIIGDPRWLPHPVQGIGLLVRVLENIIRRISQGRLAGLALVMIVIAAVSGFVTTTLHWGGFPAAVYWIFSCIAVRSLDDHAFQVIAALSRGNLEQARNLVSQIVPAQRRDRTSDLRDGLSSVDLRRAIVPTYGWVLRLAGGDS